MEKKLMVPVTIEALPDGGWEVVHRERVADMDTAFAIAEWMAGALGPTPVQKQKSAKAQSVRPVTAIAA